MNIDLIDYNEYRLNMPDGMKNVLATVRGMKNIPSCLARHI